VHICCDRDANGGIYRQSVERDQELLFVYAFVRAHNGSDNDKRRTSSVGWILPSFDDVSESAYISGRFRCNFAYAEFVISHFDGVFDF
jgi:hypothetical protein